MSHTVELDDVHKASILHAGAAIIPAALTAAEKFGVDGRKLIEGIVVGYEVAKWPAEVEIMTMDAQSVRGRTEYPRGDPENPVTQEQLAAKFRELAGSYYEDQAVEDLILSINELENIADLSAMLHYGRRRN